MAHQRSKKAPARDQAVCAKVRCLGIAFCTLCLLIVVDFCSVLSWGLPHWVGNTNGSVDGVLSPQGVKYHTDYLAGAKQAHGISFDYIGIWNESPWTRSYIKELRSALDSQGMGETQIVVPDGGSKGCLDCQEFGSDDITVALAQDKQLTRAVDVIGIHGHDVEGTAGGKACIVAC